MSNYATPCIIVSGTLSISYCFQQLAMLVTFCSRSETSNRWRLLSKLVSQTLSVHLDELSQADEYLVDN